MKIAYFIGIHKNAAQFAQLLEAIYRDDDLFLIHIDKKQTQDFVDQIRETAAGRPNVHLLKRHAITWAGWSQCEMELDALARFCRPEHSWDFWINLSGQDYPLKPPAEIAAFLAANREKNFIDAREIQSLEPKLRGVVERRYAWLCVEAGGRTRRLPLPTGPFIGSKITHYGSSWHILSRAFCDWVVAEGAERARFMRFTKSADEFLLQYLILNSPFADTLENDNHRFYIFRGKPNPETLTEAHFDEVAESDAFFARKFEPQVSQALINSIEQRLLTSVDKNPNDEFMKIAQ